MLDAQVVKLGNWLTRLRRTRVKPENLLLLFPHCAQWSKCIHNITNNLDNCKRCGRCKVKDFIELSERLGIQCAVASGGRQAVKRVKREDVKAVLAVACEKELREGMFATFPKPVIGVINLRPHGPCVDTDADMEKVEAEIREFITELDTFTTQSCETVGQNRNK